MANEPRVESVSARSGRSGDGLFLSVVIPTYRKGGTLETVLRALERLDVPVERFEVVVIDDGSPDDTLERMQRFSTATTLRLRYVRQDNRGVSAARNRGAREAVAPIVLLIQDDIVAAPDLLSRHLDAHRRHPEVTATVSGLVRWPPDWAVDDFMRWLDHGGPQFRYHEVLGRDRIDFKHFYTCNVSLKRQALIDNPFDEEIVYGFEDIELAFRLQARGFTFYFDERAIGYHHHRRTLEDFRRRQYAAGRSLYVAFRNHPELRGRTGRTSMSSWKRLRTRVRGVVAPLALRLGAPGVLEKYWKAVLDEEIVRGYHEARENDHARSASTPTHDVPRPRIQA